MRLFLYITLQTYRFQVAHRGDESRRWCRRSAKERGKYSTTEYN